MYGRRRKGCVFMVDYLCDMGAFSKLIFMHVNIGSNISDPPGTCGNNRKVISAGWAETENVKQMQTFGFSVSPFPPDGTF